MIANYLFANKVEVPNFHNGCNKDKIKNPFRWSIQSISQILSHPEYCGDTINFKTSELGDKKVFFDTQPAIINLIRNLQLSIEKILKKFKNYEN